MLYKKFSPSEALSPYIECYFVWKGEHTGTEDFIVESPPSGFCSIVFNLGEPYRLQNRKYEQLLVPNCFIAGQSIYIYQLRLAGKIDSAGIVFKPAALSTLFELPIYQYTEERVELSKVFLPALVERLSTALKNEPEPIGRARILDQFLLDHVNQNQPTPDAIDRVANTIVEKNGLVHLADLLDGVFMSRRNFERRFFRKVGLSPKYYARLRRMSYLFNLIAGKKRVEWAKVFSECEYYDHSHLTKDFVEFVGMTPAQFLEKNRLMANFVERPRQQPL